MKVAIEPLFPSDLPKMLEALHKINKSNPFISQISIFWEMIVKLFLFIFEKKKRIREIVLKFFFIYNDVVILSCYFILNYIL